VDVLAGEAEVGSGGQKAVPVWNGFFGWAALSVAGHLPQLLSSVVPFPHFAMLKPVFQVPLSTGVEEL
jgi:hypothetical protein